LSEIEDQHQASQAFDQLYENMKKNGEIQGKSSKGFCLFHQKHVKVFLICAKTQAGVLSSLNCLFFA